jgi:hypothetical protein
VVSALEHVVYEDIRGIYNVAADGVLAFTEVVGLLGKSYAPVLPPWGTGLAAAALGRLGVRLPPEMLQQMRFGRGLDNRKLKATAFRYRYTTRETVSKLAEHMRLHPVVRGAREPYRYEREVEDFLRWSPHVRNPTYRKESRLSPGEMAELQRVMASYSERVGAPVGPGGPSRRAQSQVVAAVAGAGVPADAAEQQGELGEAGAQPGPAAEQPAAAAEQRTTAEPAAEAATDQQPRAAEQPASAIRPRARRPDPSPKRAAAREARKRSGAAAAPPLDHYDDLDADEIVTLVGSLEGPDLDALLDYERDNRGRPRVVSAIEGARARRRD